MAQFLVTVRDDAASLKVGEAICIAYKYDPINGEDPTTFASRIMSEFVLSIWKSVLSNKLKQQTNAQVAIEEAKITITVEPQGE